MSITAFGAGLLLISSAGASDSVHDAASDLVERATISFRYTPLMDDVESRDDAVISSAMMQDAPAAPVRYGQEDTWWMTVHGGGAMDLEENDNLFGLGGVGFSYFMIDNVSLELEFNGLYFSQTGDDALGANFNLLLRWHLLAEDTWSLFIDGGAGVLGTTEDVPAAEGSQFNFTPQAGGGLTFDIGENARLVTGVRWHHVSNANLFDDNTGRDSVYGYVGVTFPF